MIGAILVAAGGAFFLAALLRLGSALTPLPYPKEGASLVQTGPFSLVRHPIYSGGLIASIGIALMVSGWLTLVYVAALFVLLDIKSRQEERWLVAEVPRVRRLPAPRPQAVAVRLLNPACGWRPAACGRHAAWTIRSPAARRRQPQC